MDMRKAMRLADQMALGMAVVEVVVTVSNMVVG
jgi:hypothetical protein